MYVNNSIRQMAYTLRLRYLYILQLMSSVSHFKNRVHVLEAIKSETNLFVVGTRVTVRRCRHQNKYSNIFAHDVKSSI